MTDVGSGDGAAHNAEVSAVDGDPSAVASADQNAAALRDFTIVQEQRNIDAANARIETIQGQLAEAQANLAEHQAALAALQGV